MRVLLLFVLAVLASSAQPNRFSATTGDLSLNGAGTVFTLQQAATGSKKIILETATVYCSVACNVSQAQQGTAATATAGTANGVQPSGPSATATVWTASNVGAGTSVGPILHLTAAGTLVIDLTKVYFSKTSTSATNYTITVSSITGTANVTFLWSEQ